MIPIMASPMEFLTTRLHARRVPWVDREGFDAACHLPSVGALAQTRYPDGATRTAPELHRRLVADAVAELADSARSLTGPARRLVDWLSVSWQLDRVRILLRARVARAPPQAIQACLASLPAAGDFDLERLAEAGSLRAFGERLPAGAPRDALLSLLDRSAPDPPLFLLEAALNRGYLAVLLERGAAVPLAERDLLLPLFRQEADLHHLQAILRGRFIHGLTPDQLSPLHLPGTNLPRCRFRRMLASPDLAGVAGLAVGRVIDTPPSTAATPGSLGSTASLAAALEHSAWERFGRLARRAYRRSHLGIAALAGHAALRRLEIANWIALAEGLRTRTRPEAIRLHFRRTRPESGSRTEPGPGLESIPSIPPPGRAHA